MNDSVRGLLLVLLMSVSMKPAAALAVHCTVREPFAYTAPYDLEECPPDIQAWMDRTNGCAALMQGGSAGLEEQDAVAEEKAELECDFLPCDFQGLIEKYKGNGVMTNIVEGYKKMVYGDNGGLACSDSP